MLETLWTICLFHEIMYLQKLKTRESMDTSVAMIYMHVYYQCISLNNKEKIFLILLSLQTQLIKTKSVKIMNRHTGGMWSIHIPKHSKDKAWNTPAWYSNEDINMTWRISIAMSILVFSNKVWGQIYRWEVRYYRHIRIIYLQCANHQLHHIQSYFTNCII